MGRSALTPLRSALVPSARCARPARTACAPGPHQAAGSGGSGSGAPGMVLLSRGGVFRPAAGDAHRDVVLGTGGEGTEPGEGGRHLSPG